MASILALANEKKRSSIDLTNKFRMIKICNLPSAASKLQILTLFSFFGETDMAAIYPTDLELPVINKVAFLRFLNPEHAAGAIHLTNTIYLDKILIVTPVPDEQIPAEEHLFVESQRWSALAKYENLALSGATSSDPNFKYHMGYAHVPPEPKYDQNLPPLKMSEIKRTIYVHNLHKQVSAEILMTLFAGIGDVKFVKVAPYYDSEFNYGLVEFNEEKSIPLALQYNDFPLCGIPIKTDYSLMTIEKRNVNKRNRYNDADIIDGSGGNVRRAPSPDWKRGKFDLNDSGRYRTRSPRRPSPRRDRMRESPQHMNRRSNRSRSKEERKSSRHRKSSERSPKH